MGTPTLINMLIPLTTSFKDRSCGVVTINVPSNLSFWDMEIWTSPVPGGKSTIK